MHSPPNTISCHCSECWHLLVRLYLVLIFKRRSLPTFAYPEHRYPLPSFVWGWVELSQCLPTVFRELPRILTFAVNRCATCSLLPSLPSHLHGRHSGQGVCWGILRCPCLPHVLWIHTLTRGSLSRTLPSPIRNSSSHVCLIGNVKLNSRRFIYLGINEKKGV